MFVFLVGYISRQGHFTIVKLYQDISSCLRYIRNNTLYTKPDTFYILPFVCCDDIKQSGIDWEGVTKVHVRL